MNSTAIPLQNATIQGVDHAPITYYSTLPFPETGPFPIYATSNDTTVVDDACAPLPATTPDLSSYLVIVKRGTCAFTQKLANIAAKGGKRAFIYNNIPGLAGISVGNFSAVLIGADDGAFLVGEFIKGDKITVTFPQVGGSFNYPDPHGGLVSDFTSYG